MEVGQMRLQKSFEMFIIPFFLKNSSSKSLDMKLVVKGLYDLRLGLRRGYFKRRVFEVPIVSKVSTAPSHKDAE